MYEALRQSDPSVFQALELEVQRQRHHLELIASENYASRANATRSGVDWPSVREPTAA
jgi:glycine hydroxymethyltransferase